MESKHICITEQDYYTALEQHLGHSGLYYLQEQFSTFDHQAGLLYQTRIDSYVHDLFVFSIVDIKKFQHAVIKYSLKFQHHHEISQH